MKSLFRKFLKLIQRLARGFKSLVNNYANDVIDALKVINEIINDPKADIVVRLTESDLDNKALTVLRDVFAILFPEVKDKAKGKKMPEQLALFIDQVRTFEKPVQEAILSKAASISIQKKAKARKVEITDSEADLLAQVAYKAKKESIVL